MRLRIGVLAIVGVGLVTAAVIGGMSMLILRAHRDALVAQLTGSADRLSETIGRSTYYDMLENRRDAVHREILTIGAQKGIEKVRLFNATGTIMFSSDEREVGRSVDRRAEACSSCHAADQPLHRLSTQERSRIYASPEGHRVLGMIRPIHNEAACWNAACHAHSSSSAVLGVLDVNLSMREVDLQLARDQRRLLLLAVLAIAASSLLLWWLTDRLVLRPVAVLTAGTRKVAEGDLRTTLPATARHELGDLARAFNDMTHKLAEAQRQLTQADKLASVGRLAAGVAHEINNPLTGVLTYASVLHKRADDPALRDDLEVIVRETKRCRDIVRGLLDFARPAPPKRQPTDLNEVARRGVTVVMNQLALSQVSLDLDLASDLDPVPADGNQIQQVVVNLLLNAADAIGDQGGNIRLATRAVAMAGRGSEIVRAARCPRGCDLIDPSVRIGGHPAVRVLRRVGDTEAILHLDPLYGRASHQSAGSCELGAVASHRCPSCRGKLELPGRTCVECGAPVFAVDTGATGRLEWCSRTGCRGTRWDAVDRAPERSFAELTVEDSGQGIAPEHLDHLFEPFFSTKGTRGTGLGLAVTWGIVEAHGGTIEVQSEVGHGTRFTVRLPYGSTAVAASRPALEPPAEPTRGAA